MRGMGLLTDGLRALAAALLVLAVAVRVAVPAGYMLGEDTSGQIQIELCTEHGVVSRTIDLETGEYVEPGGDTPAEDGQGAPDGCVFAAGAQIAAPVSQTPDLQQLKVIREAGLHHPVAFEISGRLEAARPYPTGPPATL